MNEIWTSGITGHCLEIRRSALPGMYAAGKMGRSYPVHEIYMSVCPPMPRPLLRFQKVPSIAQKNGLKRIGVFVDVRPGDYFSDAVAWAVKHGITAGVGGNKFAPNDPCTRGQIVTMLWALAGKPEPVDYNVSPAAYYAKAAQWARSCGISAGVGDNKFAPDDPCTRGQIVTMLYKTKK